VPKKRGNPNWGKGEVNTLPSAGASSFQDIVKKLCLSPVEYGSSIQFKEWVRKNKDQKYVTLNLLHAWGLEVKGDLVSGRLIVPVCGRRHWWMRELA